MKRITLAAASLAIAVLFAVSTQVDAQSSNLRVYWTELNTDTVKRANPDGSSVETLLDSGLSNPYGIAVDQAGGKIYWTESSGSSVKTANLDGSSPTTLVTGLSSPYGIAVNPLGGKVYWVEIGSNTVKRANLDGSSVETLVSSGVSDPNGIAVNPLDGKIYWTELGSDTVKRANLDGSSVETLVSSGVSDPRDITVDPLGGKIYWTDDGGDTVKRANLDGSSQSILVNTSSMAFGIAVDPQGGKIYWVDNTSVNSANLDGSSPATLISGVSASRGIAIPTLFSVPRVIVTGVTETTVVLDWDDIEDATDYQYRYKTSEEVTWGTPVTVTESSALVSGLISGTAYNFQARSRENGNASDWSVVATATPSPRKLSISRWPARVGGLTVVSEGTDAVQLLWQHQVSAAEYEIGLWEAGQILPLSLIQGATSTIINPDPWTQIIESVGVNAGATYGKFDEEQPYIGIYADDPAKLIMLHHRRYSSDFLYYWNTDLGRWRVLRCKNPTNADDGCDYGTPSSTDVEVLLTISTSIFGWHTLEDGPPDWAGLYGTEANALESVENAGDRVIFLDALGFTRYAQLNSTTPSAILTGIPAGRHYLSVRGKNATGQDGDWAYLVIVGDPGTTPDPVEGQPIGISGIIYTDEVPNIEHYLLDETTLILHWQNIPGARHYDVRINGLVTRITSLSGSGQQVAYSLASLAGTNLEYQARAVIETGSLDVRVKNAEGTVIYVVPPNSTVFSRWSADRSLNVERQGRIRGPGAESLMADRGAPGETITGMIGDVLKVSTLVEEDADQDSLQVWTVPLGLLGSIFMGGLTGYGARRGGMDKAVVVAGGLVFFVCWAYLCPVYLRIDWMIIFAVLVLVIGAAIVVVLNDFFR